MINEPVTDSLSSPHTMSMIDKYQEVRSYSEKLASLVRPEDSVVQPVYYASPTKWHLAHTTWFFEEMILNTTEDYTVFDPQFGFLFNSYYNTVGERTLRAERGNITRPGLDEILKYRKHVDDEILSRLQDNLLDHNQMELLELGLNHEEQHQELLITDLKFTLGHNPLFPFYSDEFDLVSVKNKEEGWLKVEEGIAEIGFEGNAFSFDNEHNRHKVYLHEFEISKALVTNGEFIEFMEAGGYEEFRYWLDEGWSWVNENEIKSPLYWHKIKGDWYQYTLAGLKKIKKEDILCHISFYEANAYATWRGMRLPTEAEWEVAAKHLDWGQRWEWTNSAYLPYPGFKISEGAVGEYNGKFMVNQMVLRGASKATSKGHSRKTYRNFFHPHFQWQYSGIRLVKS